MIGHSVHLSVSFLGISLNLACLASVSVRVRRESLDESKKEESMLSLQRLLRRLLLTAINYIYHSFKPLDGSEFLFTELLSLLHTENVKKLNEETFTF